MIRSRLFAFFTFILLGLIADSGHVRAGVLTDVSRAQQGHTRRWSTGLYDPESNRDMYPVKAGERLTFCELDGSDVSVERIRQLGTSPVSGGTVRMVRLDEEGGEVEFRLASPRQPGRFDVVLELTTGPDHGVTQWLLDGRPLGKPFNAYSTQPGIRTVKIPGHTLGRSLHTLTIRPAGKDSASNGTQAGLDKITLTWLPE